ncbi:MAG TPA: hypothetical protein VFC44_17160 [Candidatus Saccharimonadales bacterium]|nr:hypothetical protein [Candidatus Saccharimonadales bacterium]
MREALRIGQPGLLLAPMNELNVRPRRHNWEGGQNQEDQIQAQRKFDRRNGELNGLLSDFCSFYLAADRLGDECEIKNNRRGSRNSSAYFLLFERRM